MASIKKNSMSTKTSNSNYNNNKINNTKNNTSDEQNKNTRRIQQKKGETRT